jgi:hypothetical protein
MAATDKQFPLTQDKLQGHSSGNSSAFEDENVRNTLKKPLLLFL